MQFLRTAWWVVIAVAAALFFKANNRPVEIKVWGDIVWETKIWFPMLLAFLLGALPFWVMARATRWRLKRRLDSAERALVAATVAPAPAATPESLSPAAIPDSAASTPTLTGPA
ncbi:lipopolysaccharide assembly protein LapA domain-containing protein [Sphingobium sp.]|uniref:lipopolysaccharide assembly protein LapA domain-containing protein n=1 Tax=Sphingobium sp. TaxID=1912891 RepID=UPI00261EF77D|nr:lipopolysaccharide assembly protein LapA domain-containing protein [Sphingobium sp.]